MGFFNWLNTESLLKKVDNLISEGQYMEAANICLKRCKMPGNQNDFAYRAGRSFEKVLENGKSADEIVNLLSNIFWEIELVREVASSNRNIPKAGGSGSTKTRLALVAVLRIIDLLEEKKIDSLYDVRNTLKPLFEIWRMREKTNPDFVEEGLGVPLWAEKLAERGNLVQAAYLQVEYVERVAKRIGHKINDYLPYPPTDARNYIKRAEQKGKYSKRVIDDLRNLYKSKESIEGIDYLPNLD